MKTDADLCRDVMLACKCSDDSCELVTRYNHTKAHLDMAYEEMRRMRNEIAILQAENIILKRHSSD